MNNDWNDIKWNWYHKPRMTFERWCKTDSTYDLIISIATAVLLFGAIIAGHYLTAGTIISCTAALAGITCYFRRHY